jgi:hypothetical protein
VDKPPRCPGAETGGIADLPAWEVWGSSAPNSGAETGAVSHAMTR